MQCRIDKDTGEIQVKGECLMLGYYKQPDVTKATMTDDGWLKTGDKGTIDAEGNLKITGRVKDLFKTAKGNTLRRRRSKTSCPPRGARSHRHRRQPGAAAGPLMLNPELPPRPSHAAARRWKPPWPPTCGMNTSWIRTSNWTAW